MSDLDDVLGAVAAAFEGDADLLADRCWETVTFRDHPDEPERVGVEEVVAHFAAFGGRRERFLLGAVIVAGDRAAISYAVAFRADASAYGQRGMAMLELRGGRLAAWDGVWVETSVDLSAWGHD